MMKLHRQETGETLNPEEIVARAEGGDPNCERTLQSYENRLARSLAHVINILDPDVIVGRSRYRGEMIPIDYIQSHNPPQPRKGFFAL